MKKFISLLLVAVMLTTCVISGTFAKYVTKDSANDSARVAKFGVARRTCTWFNKVFIRQAQHDRRS